MRLLKWTGTLACLVMSLAIFSSVFWAYVVIKIGNWTVGVSGWYFIHPRVTDGVPGFWIVSTPQRDASPATWKYIVESTGHRTTPLGIPLTAFGVPTALLWLLDRPRRAPGACRCGYDLTGNTSGRCPECGQRAEPVA